MPIEPEMHKSMLLVLSRVYDYSLKTEDLLDLTNGNRQIALITVVSLLEDGEATVRESRFHASNPRFHRHYSNKNV